MSQEQQTPIQPRAPYPQPATIDFVELGKFIRKDIKFFAGVVGAIFLVALLYVVIAPKEYQATVELSPPEPNEISQLSYDFLPKVTPMDVYQEFLKNLDSLDNRVAILKKPEFQQLFEGSQVIDADLYRFAKEKTQLSLPLEDRKKTLTAPLIKAELSANFTQPQLLVPYLEALVNYSAALTKTTFSKNSLDELIKQKKQFELDIQNEIQLVKANIKAEIEKLNEVDTINKSNIQQKINALIQKEQDDRQARILRLQESLIIAEKLGILTPISPIEYTNKNREDKTTKIDVSNREPVGYWMGSKILAAEIENLKSRKTSAAFVDEITDLQRQLKELEVNQTIIALQNRTDYENFSEKLRALNVQRSIVNQRIELVKASDFNVYKIIKNPVEPLDPVKPKIKIILVGALFLGVFVAFFLVLIRYGLVQRKIKEEQA